MPIGRILLEPANMFWESRSIRGTCYFGEYRQNRNLGELALGQDAGIIPLLRCAAPLGIDPYRISQDTEAAPPVRDTRAHSGWTVW